MTVLSLLLLVQLMAPSVKAQGVITTQFNGVPYTCTPTAGGSSVPGAGAAQCAATAYQGPFSQAQAIALCAGASSQAPAVCAAAAYQGPYSLEQALAICTGAINNSPFECANAAYRGPFSLAQSMQLCRAAYSNGPVDCALKAYQGAYNLEQSLRLCSFPSASADTADCAARAYQGPYTIEQSIQLCHPGAGPSAKKTSASLEKTMLNALIKNANEKAVRAGEYKLEP